MAEEDWFLDVPKVYSLGLPMQAMSVFMRIVEMSIEQQPIRADAFNQDDVKLLIEKKIVAQSGNSLRIPRDIFRLT